MFVYAVSFLAGASQLLWLPQISLNWSLATLIVAIVLSFYLFYRPKYQRIISAIIIFLIGFSYAVFSAQLNKNHQLKEVPSQFVSVKGLVVELPRVTPKKTRFILEVEKSTPKMAVNRILVNWYGSKQKITPGQVWQLKLKLKPIHALYNPATFDYSKWLFRHGVDATATVKDGQLLEKSQHNLFSKINEFRLKITAIIQENISSERVASLLIALTVGNKSYISYEDSQLFQITGTAHLIAISGLHIGLIAFVGLLIGRLFFNLLASQRYNRFVFEAVFSIFFALIYALLAGLSVPTIRALVMVVVFALSYALKSQVSRWHAWSFALLVVLLLDPLSVLDAGFWFSFIAVAVLMFAYTGKAFENSKVGGFIKAQLVILVGLMPLMIIVFHQFNLLTPFANFLILPLASIVLIPLLFLTLFVYLFSTYLASLLFLSVEKVTQLLFYLLDNLQHFSFLNVSLPTYNNAYILVLCLLAIIVLLPRLFRWKWVVLILLVPLFIKSENDLYEQEVRLRVIDVAQGLSILVQTQNHTMVYDTGAKYESGFSMAKAAIIPLLQSYGIKKIDKLILSHADNDHAGGVKEVVDAFEPDIFDVKGLYNSCQYPLTWQWDGVEFEVLSPFELEPYLGNNASCVIKITSIYGSVLLTADIEEPVEYRLLSQFPEKIKSDVLIVPHHGSKSSSSQNFIQGVSPKYAINSSGYANQFNHPHALIKQRYTQRGIKFYDTQSSGMITIDIGSNGVKVTSYLAENKHFWHTSSDSKE
ncbi:MAG: DNA internalization-related competence protein ComEC/Rec2 [Proteobacteria bacterium]|nr:DNA internalization-related competence protein ComEC/Rec2 [Pseudomonadota bacterium]